MLILLAFVACIADKGDSGSNSLSTTDIVDQDNCEDPDLGQSNDVPGAERFFTGEFTLSGDDVTGIEKWVLFANETWKDMAGADDCEIVWNIVGRTTETGNCAHCDLGLSMTATLDRQASSCIEGPEEGYESQQLSYDVMRKNDGTTTWYFPSGTVLGEGFHSGNELNYATEGACIWF